MDTVSSSPSLNPASTPFFPGGGGYYKEDDSRSLGLGFHRRSSRERFATASSSLSVSPTEYRSVKSSPSPSQDGRDHRAELASEFSSPEVSRQSPAIPQQDGERAYQAMQRQLARESSMSAIPEVPPDGEETPGPLSTNGAYQQNTYYSSMMSRARERLSTPPVATDISSRTSSFTSGPNHFMSSSPASSLDSGSMFTPSIDLSTSHEAHLKSSPLIHDLFVRMERYETVTAEIQHELMSLGRKVEWLVEKALHADAAPEFRNPFASSSTPSFATPNHNGLAGPRGSIIGNIAPNQAGPSDDMSLISHRLNSLTTSVDTLLALSTQQANAPGLQTPQLLGHSPQQSDILGRGLVQPGTNSSAILGHGITSRPSPRIPGPPARTWSVGTLDIPPRTMTDSPAGTMSRADNGVRDKRRSVAGLMRRDSAVVRPAQCASLSAD